MGQLIQFFRGFFFVCFILKICQKRDTGNPLHLGDSWICHARASRSGGLNVILREHDFSFFPEEKSSLRSYPGFLGAVAFWVCDVQWAEHPQKKIN